MHYSKAKRPRDIVYSSICEFIEHFDSYEDKKSFANGLKSKNTARYRSIVDILSKNNLGAYEGQWLKLVYDIKEPSKKSQKCKCCDSFVVWSQANGEYSAYCSIECSRSDGSKTSPEMYSISVAKRYLWRENLKDNNPEEYLRQIRLSVENRLNSPNMERFREMKSESIKSLIAAGKFTPNVTNSWTRWSVEIDGKKFRSSFEGLFWLYAKYTNVNYLYEDLRVSYEFDGKSRNYIVDFIDRDNMVCVEVKPNSLKDSGINKAKALIKWCNDNGYIYEVITEDNLKKMFSDMIKTDFHPFLKEFEKRYPKWK